MSAYGTGEVSASRAATSAGRVARRSLAQRIPWLWYDHVVSRTRVPLWALSLLVFALLYGVGLAFAAIDGELPQFLRDFRWLTPLGIPAICSYGAGYAPQALARFWTGIRPRLANSEDELLAFEAATPNQLMRFFWPPAVIMFIYMGQFGLFLDAPGNWAREYPHYSALRLLSFVSAPFMAYFVGGVFSMLGLGLGSFVRRMQTRLDLKRGFIIQGDKATLRPFNDLLWVIWGTTLLIIPISGWSSAPLSGGPMQLLNFLNLAITMAIMLPLIVVPQIFMNRWLSHEKAQELQALRKELDEAAFIPQSVDAAQAVRHLVRHQHLLYQIQRVEAFNPTLVDARFILQIGTSFTAILLANVVLRTVTARFLQ